MNTDVLTDTPAVTPTAANAVATRAAENKTAHGVDR